MCSEVRTCLTIADKPMLLIVVQWHVLGDRRTDMGIGITFCLLFVCVYFLFSLCFLCCFPFSFLLQYFDTVGWVLLTCKNRLPYSLTYTVLEGTWNTAQSINHRHHLKLPLCGIEHNKQTGKDPKIYQIQVVTAGRLITRCERRVSDVFSRLLSRPRGARWMTAVLVVA